MPENISKLKKGYLLSIPALLVSIILLLAISCMMPYCLLIWWPWAADITQSFPWIVPIFFIAFSIFTGHSSHLFEKYPLIGPSVAMFLAVTLYSIIGLILLMLSPPMID